MSLNILPARALSTGVALVGASVIAVSTIAPTPLQTAQISIASPVVQLAAAPSPLEFYPQVAGRTLVNAGFLAWDYITIGPAIAAALVTDPVAAFQGGVVVVGAAILLAPLFIVGSAAIIASPVTNGYGATLVAIDDINNAVAAGDPIDLTNAIIDLPARILDGVLNGGYADPGGYDGGLLSPAGVPPGPLAIPLNLLSAIPGAAGIPFPFRPELFATTPGLRAATVTLPTGPSDPGLAEAAPKAPTQLREVLPAAVAKFGNAIDELTNPAAERLRQGTEPLTQQARKLDPTIKVRPGDETQSLRTDPAVRKTPLRDALKEAGSKFNKAVTDVSSTVKKALSGRKSDAGSQPVHRRHAPKSDD